MGKKKNKTKTDIEKKEKIEKEEIEEIEEVGRTGLLVMFFIVVTIVVGGLCFIAGIVYSSYLNKDEEKYEEKVNSTEEKKTETSNETIVEDETIKEELNKKKTAIIDSSHKYDIYNFFKKDVSNTNLSDDIKMKIALTITQIKNDEKYSKTEVLESISKVENKEYRDYSGNYLEIEDLDKEYFELWGEKPNKYKTYQLYNRFIYLKDLNIYAINENGELDACNGEIIFYDYSVTEDDYYYYLYSSLGSVRLDKCTNKKTYNTIFADPNEDTEYTKDYDDTFEISEDNYEEFSKYKITFKKGAKQKISFSKIERLQ